MIVENISHKFLFIIYCILIVYLLSGTGVVSDDFDGMASLKGKNFFSILIPGKDFSYVETPVEFYTHYIWYYLFNPDNPIAINIFKSFYIVLSFYMISRFFLIFLSGTSALMASFLFLFFPSHDSTTFWFMGQYLTLSMALYFFAFYMAYRDKLFFAFFLGLVASFLSYGSSVTAFSMFIIFMMRRQFKKAAVMLAPNLFYILYFIPLNIIMRFGSPRIIEQFTFSGFVKQFLLQMATFCDAMFGPSMWLKIYYSFSQLSVISVIAASVFIVITLKARSIENWRYDKRLVIALAAMSILSFVMFAFTGRYPQIAFNLGNRVTIFGSIFVVYIMMLMPAPRLIKFVVYALIIFSIFGISDHWKAWNINEAAVIKRIANNPNLRNYTDKRVIYVSGNQYSKYGPISHIEFMTENSIAAAVFRFVFGGRVSADAINRRSKYIDGYVVDIKYQSSAKVDDYINIYDSEKDTLLRVKADDINSYISALPVENRHWIQLLKIPFIKRLILQLMPRLNYALQDAG